MIRFMVDIETLGLTPNAALVSIGACASDGRPDFSQHVDLRTCEIFKMYMSASTLQWWSKQPDNVRKQLYSEDAQPITTVLRSFYRWLDLPADYAEYELWCYSTSFDFVVLENAYSVTLNIDPPWHYRSLRDLRTLAAIFPQVARVQPSEADKHTAIGDAKAQMEWLTQLLEAS